MWLFISDHVPHSLASPSGVWPPDWPGFNETSDKVLAESSDPPCAPHSVVINSHLPSASGSDLVPLRHCENTSPGQPCRRPSFLALKSSIESLPLNSTAEGSSQVVEPKEGQKLLFQTEEDYGKFCFLFKFFRVWKKNSVKEFFIKMRIWNLKQNYGVFRLFKEPVYTEVPEIQMAEMAIMLAAE